MHGLLYTLRTTLRSKNMVARVDPNLRGTCGRDKELLLQGLPYLCGYGSCATAQPFSHSDIGEERSLRSKVARGREPARNVGVHTYVNSDIAFQ